MQIKRQTLIKSVFVYKFPLCVIKVLYGSESMASITWSVINILHQSEVFELLCWYNCLRCSPLRNAWRNMQMLPIWARVSPLGCWFRRVTCPLVLVINQRDGVISLNLVFFLGGGWLALLSLHFWQQIKLLLSCFQIYSCYSDWLPHHSSCK